MQGSAVRHERIRCSFVSNVDVADIASVLADSDPASTLFVTISATADPMRARAAGVMSQRTAQLMRSRAAAAVRPVREDCGRAVRPPWPQFPTKSGDESFDACFNARGQLERR